MCTFPFWCLLVTESIWLGTSALLQHPRFSNGRLFRHGTVFQTASVTMGAVFMLGLSCSWFHSPGFLYTGGQETLDVPEHTACVYVMPDGSWNESALFSSLFAQCDQVAVAYQSELSCLQDSYEYISGHCVMVMISEGLEAEPVLEEVRRVLHTQDLSIAYTKEYGGVKIICLSDNR